MATFGLDRKRRYEEGSDQEFEPVKPLLKMRAESYEVEVPNADWVLSLTAPTHVATSKASFTTYTPWQSMVRFGKTGSHNIVGIGTVSFESLVKPGSDETQAKVIEDVLHIPGLICNIYSVTRMVSKGWSLSVNGEHAIFTRGRNETPDYAVWCEGLYRLALPSRPVRPSKLAEGENYVLAFDWPMAERHAWEGQKRELKQAKTSEIDTRSRSQASASPEPNPSIANRADVHRCKGCNRNFPSRNSLNNHRRDKTH